MRSAGYGEHHYRAVLTVDIVRQARHLHNDGVSYAKLGEQFGVSKDAIRKALIGNTWKRVDKVSSVSRYKPKGVNKSRLSKEGRERIKELHQQGRSIDEITKLVGVHRGTVYKYIKDSDSSLSPA